MKNLIKIISMLAAVSLLSSCALFHHSTPPPMAKLTNYKPELQVARVWKDSISSGTDKRYLRLNPAISKGVIYTSSYLGDVTAIDSKTGKIIWRQHLKTQLTSGPGVGKGVVIVGGGDGHIFALNANNGSLKWQVPVSSEVLAAPTVSADLVLVKSEDGQLTAYKIYNGRRSWSFGQQTPNLILRASSSPISYQGNVVAGFANGEIAVLNLYSGASIWQRAIAVPQGSSDIQRMIDIDADPVVKNGVIYTATYQGQIAALQLRTGRVLWKHKISSYAGIAVGPRYVFVSDAGGHVWAFDRASGAVAWKQNNLFGRGLTGPAIVGNAIVVGDKKGYLHWLARSDGRFLTRVRVDSRALYAAPIAQGNNMVVAYDSNGVLAKYQVAPIQNSKRHK